jgi:hypothetical protein
MLIDSRRLAAFRLGFHVRQLRSIVEEGIKGVRFRAVPEVHHCRRSVDDAALVLSGHLTASESDALREALHRAGELHDLGCAVCPDEEADMERGALAKLQQEALGRIDFLTARVARSNPTLAAWRDVGTALAELSYKVLWVYEAVPILPEAWDGLNNAVDRLPSEERGLAAPLVFGIGYRTLAELTLRLQEAYDDICQCLSTPDPPNESAAPVVSNQMPDRQATPPVILRGHGMPPVVRGVAQRILSKAQYEVVQALLDAGPTGLSKDELEEKSKHADARKILKRLHDSYPDWKRVILLAGRPGGRYRLLFD